jgi:adenosylhomocysteine nucleosidase
MKRQKKKTIRIIIYHYRIWQKGRAGMIGIIGAMEEEVAALKEEMQTEEVKEIAGMTFVKGVLCGRDAVVVRSGIGKVNAALCAQILASEFGVDALINTGIAGSLDARIDIGDIVISTDALYHDMDASKFGDPVGQIPRMDVFSFEADPRLVGLAKEANQEANPDIHTFTGRVVSGDQFIADAEDKERIKNNFDPLCTEMEGAGIAHAAYLNGISYVIIRAISDKADNSASMDYPAFEKQAIIHSVRLVKTLLSKMTEKGM